MDVDQCFSNITCLKCVGMSGLRNRLDLEPGPPSWRASWSISGSRHAAYMTLMAKVRAPACSFFPLCGVGVLGSGVSGLELWGVGLLECCRKGVDCCWVGPGLVDWGVLLCGVFWTGMGLLSVSIAHISCVDTERPRQPMHQCRVIPFNLTF